MPETTATATQRLHAAQEAQSSYAVTKAKVDEFKEITERLESAREEYANLCREINKKNQELRTVQSSIQSHDFTLLRMTEKWEKDTEEKTRIIGVRQAEVDKASQEYKDLLRDLRQKQADVDNQLANLSKERLAAEAEVKKWQLFAETRSSEADKREIDVKTREKLLAEDKEQFEKYKATIEPDLQRVSSLKNENIILLSELNKKTSMLEKEEAHIAHLKEKLHLDTEKSKEDLAQKELLLVQKEENLAKREGELSDYALEVQAKEAEVQKQRKRYELTEKIKETK